LSVNTQKAALRKHLLEKRDATSAELREISREKIHHNLKKISAYTNSENIACYFPIGREINTYDIMLDILEQNKNLLLPRIVNDNLQFYIISNLEKLENLLEKLINNEDILEKSKQNALKFAKKKFFDEEKLIDIINSNLIKNA